MPKKLIANSIFFKCNTKHHEISIYWSLCSDIWTTTRPWPTCGAKWLKKTYRHLIPAGSTGSSRPACQAAKERGDEMIVIQHYWCSVVHGWMISMINNNIIKDMAKQFSCSPNRTQQIWNQVLMKISGKWQVTGIWMWQSISITFKQSHKLYLI